MGTHGNVTLTYRDDMPPPESIQVNYPSSDTPVAPLRIKIYTSRDYVAPSAGVIQDKVHINDNNDFFKTAMCHFHTNDGHCRKGDLCQFAHGVWSGWLTPCLRAYHKLNQKQHIICH